MQALLLVLALAVLLTPTLLPEGQNTDHIVRCSTSSTSLGQAAQVTCQYFTDVSNAAIRPLSLTVELYREDGSKPENVLECAWDKGITDIMECPTLKGGYALSGPVDTLLHLNISSLSQSHMGRYACKMMTDEYKNTHTQTCNMTADSTRETSMVPMTSSQIPPTIAAATDQATLTRDTPIHLLPSSTTSDKQEDNSTSGVNVGGVVGGVVSVLFVVAIVVMMVLHFKYRCCKSWSFCRSAKRKQVDQETPEDNTERLMDTNTEEKTATTKTSRKSSTKRHEDEDKKTQKNYNRGSKKDNVRKGHVKDKIAKYDKMSTSHEKGESGQAKKCRTRSSPTSKKNQLKSLGCTPTGKPISKSKPDDNSLSNEQKFLEDVLQQDTDKFGPQGTIRTSETTPQSDGHDAATQQRESNCRAEKRGSQESFQETDPETSGCDIQPESSNVSLAGDIDEQPSQNENIEPKSMLSESLKEESPFSSENSASPGSALWKNKDSSVDPPNTDIKKK